MTTNFDEIGDDYKKLENNLMKRYLEEPTVFNVLKDVQAKAVLDLACGYGIYAREIKRRGAAYVVGVDISEKMIAHARMLESELPLGIEYMLGDGAKLKQIGSFDIITAVYLFPYAQTEQTLEDMARGVYNNLKLNGRLVAVIDNPDITEKHMAAPEKFNIRMEVKDPIQDGAPIKITVFTEEEPIEISNFYWSRETYERVLRKVGFQAIEWHAIIVAEEGIKEYGQNFWQEYLQYPHIIVLECFK